MQALKNNSKTPDFNKNPEGNLGILFFYAEAERWRVAKGEPTANG